MEPIPYSSFYAFYPSRTYLTQPQPLERIVGTDNRAFNMICSGALQKILQRWKRLLRLRLRWREIWIKSQFGSFIIWQEVVAVIFPLLRKEDSDLDQSDPRPIQPPPNTLAPPIFNGRQVRHFQESNSPYSGTKHTDIKMKNHEKIYEPVYLVRDSKCMRLLWVNFKMGHFRGSSAGIFQLSCYQDRL